MHCSGEVHECQELRMSSPDKHSQQVYQILDTFMSLPNYASEEFLQDSAGIQASDLLHLKSSFP